MASDIFLFSSILSKSRQLLIRMWYNLVRFPDPLVKSDLGNLTRYSHLVNRGSAVCKDKQDVKIRLGRNICKT